MQVLLTTDAHLTLRQPKNRNTIFIDNMLDKLRWLFRFMKKRKVDVWLDGGDFFDNPSQNCLLINQIIEIFMANKKYDAHFILGNHVIRGNVESSLAKGGLKTMAAMNLIQLEDDPYVWTCPESGCKVLLWHHSVVPLAVPWDHILYEDVVEQFDVDFVLCSHIHTPRKPKVIGKTTFLSPGSLARGMGNEVDPVRKVYAVLLDTSDKSFKYVSIPCVENPFKENAISASINHQTDELITYITQSMEDHFSRQSFAEFIAQMKADKMISNMAAAYLLEKYADVLEK